MGIELYRQNSEIQLIVWSYVEPKTFLKFKHMRPISKTLILITLLFCAVQSRAWQGTSIVNGGSAQGLLSQVPGMSCTGCKYISQEPTGFWQIRILPYRVNPWYQGIEVSIEYSIDSPSKIRGLNAQGGETLYNLSDFESKLGNVSIDLEIVSELITPGGGPKETYIKKLKVTGYGKQTIKTDLLTFKATAALDSLYKMHAKALGASYFEEFQSKFQFRVVSIKAVNGSAYGYSQIDAELGRKLSKAKTDNEFNTKLAEAQNAERSGRTDEAIALYEQALTMKNDSEIRQRLQTLKEQKKKETTNSSRNSGIINSASSSGSKSNNASSTSKKESIEKKEAQDAVKKDTTSSSTMSDAQFRQLMRERERQEAEQKRAQEQLATAAGGIIEGISKGSLNIGLQFKKFEQDFKEIYLDETIGVEFGGIRGFGVFDKKKNAKIPSGFVTHVDFSFPDNDGWGSIFAIGLKYGLGILNTVEIMPAFGVQYVNIHGTVDEPITTISDLRFVDENLFVMTAGLIGRFGFLFYTVDYDFTFKTTAFGIGLHFGKGN